MIAQAVVAAVNTLGSTIDSLPVADDEDFTPRITAILSDLRQLEAVAARAARIGRVTPTLIRALERGAAPDRRTDDAGGDGGRHATLGQRLYAARRSSNLTIAETAQAAGVTEDDVAGRSRNSPFPATRREPSSRSSSQLDWR